MLYLYNPINNTKKETTYELLTGITGKNYNNLCSMKSKKIKIGSINSYLIDDTFTKKDLYELMSKEVIKNEIWLPVEGSNGKYKISSHGRAKTIWKDGGEKFLTPFTKVTCKRNWLFVKMTINGKRENFALHLLVAKHFVDNPDNLPCCYHKNFNTQDNFAGNLEWISRKDLGKMTAHLKGTPVKVIDPVTNEVIDEYKNMADAGRKNFMHRETVRGYVNGTSHDPRGYKWVIDDETW